MLSSLFLVAALVCGAFSQCQGPYNWPIPTAWPSSHFHREVQYNNHQYQNKLVAYSFPTRQLRYDATYLSGKITLESVLNLTSLWLNDTLFIYTWETGAGKILPPSCVELNMGFGMMRPDWFQSGNQSGLVWQSKKSDFFDSDYHRVIMTVKDAGQGTASDDEVFTYYSYFENGTTPGTANGQPFLMHAPSPTGMVVNEYYDFEEHDFGVNNNIFQVPLADSPTCRKAGFAATFQDFHDILVQNRMPVAPHIEVLLGAMNLKEPANRRF